MIDAPQLGDFVKARFEHDGGHRIGIVRQIIQRPGKTLVRLCSPQDSFGIRRRTYRAPRRSGGCRGAEGAAPNFWRPGALRTRGGRWTAQRASVECAFAPKRRGPRAHRSK